MKNMKKLLCLGLGLCMSLTLLASCASGDTTPPAGSTAPAGSAAPAASVAPKESKLKILDTEYAVEDYAICVAKGGELLGKVNEALAALKADGTAQAIVDKYISGTANDLQFQANADGKPELHMATNAAFPPYEYYESDKIVGIDAEMAAAIADKLDMKLVIDDMEFGSILAAVQTGKADLGMAGITITDERKQSVDFTDSYATGIQSVIVTQDSPIATLDDLYAEGAAYVVGVQQDTTGDIYSTDDFGEDRVVRYNKGADAVQALLSGKVDCVIIDNEPAKSFVAAN